MSLFKNFVATMVDKVLGDIKYTDGDYFAFDNNHAKPFLPGNNPVRQKFNGYVNFHFNGDVDIPGISDVREKGVQTVLSSLIKSSEVPSAEIQTDVKNQYNKKRVTVTHAEYKPISLSAYDTVDSAWVIVLMRMYSHLFSNPLGQYDDSGAPRKIPYDVVPEKIPTGSGTSPTYGFNLGYSDNNQGYNIRPGNQKYIVSHIDIVYYHGQRTMMYTLFNPIVTNFTVEGFDHADSQPVMINMDIQYENFTINPVINGFIAEQDMERFVNINTEEWKRLRTSGQSLTQNDQPPGHNSANDTRQQASLKQRTLDFMAPQEGGKETSRLSFDQSTSDFWSAAGGRGGNT